MKTNVDPTLHSVNSNKAILTPMPKTCSIPILLASRSLSSVGFLEEKYSTLVENFNYLIRKPFTSGELIAGVEILTS